LHNNHKTRRRVTIAINPKASAQKWAPQIVLLLDEQARVLNVNRSLAGTSFSSISEGQLQGVHEQLHPNCNGKCRFNELWTKAWQSLDARDSIEWEVNDTQLQRLLRLNLSKVPTWKIVEQERRRRPPILIITDITKYRREYESLVDREQALIRLLMTQGARLANSEDDCFDESGDTGNRLMAGFVKEQRSPTHQLFLAQEDECKRVAGELHDGIAQTLGVMKYKFEATVANLKIQHPNLDGSVFDDLIDQIKGAIDEIRRISNNLVPSALEDFGVCIALELLLKDFADSNKNADVLCECVINEGGTPDLTKIAIYRVAQEALSNTAKYAAATRIRLQLEETNTGTRLTFSDDGVGFDLQKVQCSSSARLGLGLKSMRDRVEASGGKFDIESAPGKGVLVRAEWGRNDADQI
jgi:signal transduction histidine kinase